MYMGKRKTGWEVEPETSAPPLPEGYTYCPECQAAFEGDVCPGCSIGVSPGISPETVAMIEAPGLGDPEPLENGAPETLEDVQKSVEAMEPDDPPGIEVKETCETLPVKLTDLDYKEYGIKMGQANQDISKAEDELAAVKSQYKSRLDAAAARRNEYAAIINSGVVYQKVDCHVVKDYVNATITVVRLDTDEAVRTRTMHMDERQKGLGLQGET
jgi:hypothetical protein